MAKKSREAKGIFGKVRIPTNRPTIFHKDDSERKPKHPPRYDRDD